MLLGLVPQAVWAGEVIQQEEELFPKPFTGYDLQNIYVFYDPSDEKLTAVAEGIEAIVSFRINSLVLVPITAASDFDFWLRDEPWLAVYAFQSDLDSVNFQDREMPWSEFYQTLHHHRSTQHLVAMGNTLSLDSMLKPTDDTIHTSEAEQIDVLVLTLYGVYAIMEMFQQRALLDEEYQGAADDLERMVLQIYADHFNDFFQRSFEPIDTIGEMDPVAAEQRKQDMIERNPGSAEPAAYRISEDGEMEQLPLDDLPEDFSPMIKLSSPAEVGATDFSLGDLPFLSGLRGPIGKVVDVLLDILQAAGKSVISIPESALGGLQDIMEMIMPLIGVVDDIDGENPLKSIITSLVSEFPFPENLKKFLGPIINALFELRGDMGSIINVLGELITGLLPEIIPSEIMTWLDTILGFGGELWDMIGDVISDGKGAFNTILSFVTNNILTGLLNKTLVATLGVSAGTITDLVNKTVGTITSVVNYLASFDFSQFIKDVGDKLLKAGFNLLTDAVGQDTIDRIMSVIQMGFTALDLIDGYNADTIMEIVEGLATEFFGTDIVGEAKQLAERLMNVTKTFQEGGLSSIANFQTEIMEILDELTSGVATNIKEVVRDALTLITGFFNDGFNAADVPDIFDVVNDAVYLLPTYSSAYALSDAADIMEVINGAVKPIIGLIAKVTDSDGLKKMVSQTVSNFNSEIGDLGSLFNTLIGFLDSGDVLSGAPDLQNVLNSFGEITGGIMNVIGAVKGQSFEGIMQSLLMAVGSIVGMFPSFDDVPIDSFLKLLQSFFPESFGIDLDNLPSVTEIIDEILDLAGPLLSGILDVDMLRDILSIVMDIKGIFTDGIKWLLGKAYDWLTGMITPLLTDLENMLNGLFGGLSDLLGYDGELPIGLGEWSLFTLTFDLGLSANFHINPTPFFEFIRGILFEGRSPFSLSSAGDFFKLIFSFFEISPQFYANLGVEGFDSSKNPFMAAILGMLGVELAFSGSAHFKLTLFTFRNGMFDMEDFFNVVEWGLSLKVAMSRKITLLDIITGGAGGGVLSKLGSYIGLDSISIDIWFGLELDIVKKAASAIAPSISTLTIVLTLGAALNIGIDIIIASAKFYGSLEIILTFFQDLSLSSPMKITLRLIFTIKLTLQFLWWDWKKTWTWEPGGPWDLSPKQGEAEYEDSGIGFDTDKDGLSDEYEATIPGLDPTKADTDDDGANDKLEVKTMGTDPIVPDTDADGLLDGEEWDLGTNPMRADSDWDGTGDYEEVKVYGTDPLTQDTDGDGLSDTYEIRTAWDITNITPTVTEVLIGGVAYNDHTDPLNQDTDGDSIVDGDEGNTGAFYGLPTLYNDTEENEGTGDWVMDPNPLIFNGGYTHPLDADTDDDSYLQLYNGAIDTQALLFLKDMNDGAEIAGFWITIYDNEGEPERKQVFTNPCNPDTDGDTGITDRMPQPGAWINSDGYELAQTPPTDPTDGDTDDDGLLDGLEGVLSQYSNHTNPLDPDTDDDGLFDMQEMLLGTDPRNPDTDMDMIPDGEEFYTFHTNPNVWDSDMDGLGDGEEVYLWHCNPLIDDSDGDRIVDGDEVLLYGSDPMDEDSDNDGLNDFEEIVIYGTDPFTYDCDGDGLSDGSEILFYGTDPLNWDTDRDSIKEPNELGEMSWPMSDYDEIMIHGTNATEPDSDMDGLSDAYELYLGSDLIPWLDPIPLDPLSNDTDQDWLLDGSEIMLQNVSDIVYPFRGITIVFQYNTSPCVMDSDNDTLTDYQEVMVFNTNPANVDTDNDTITDWYEIWVYNTSALTNDTDWDGLFDNEETLTEVWPYGSWPPENWSIGMGTEDEPAEGDPPPEPVWPGVMPAGDGNSFGAFYAAQDTYTTSATDWDSDNDWLPDGAEVYFYHTDPMDTDSDNDGIADTFEFDTDFDGLPDGMEFGFGLQTLPMGGIFHPDSDLDGLLDGDEVFIYGTHPALQDTDGDGYSDGLEISLGLDPLVFTTVEEFQMALAMMRGVHTMQILTPKEGDGSYQNTPVTVANYTPFQDMWFRYMNGTEWSNNYTMEYMADSRLWQSTEIRWATGTYDLQVFAKNNTGIVHAQIVRFVVQSGDDPFWLYMLLLGAGVVGAVLVLGIVDYKTGKVRGAFGALGNKIRRKDSKPSKGKKPVKSTKSIKTTDKDSPSTGKKGGS